MIILAIDALEYDLVEKFNCVNLKQKFYGKTDISEFSQPMTMMLWSSFMTGRNMEAEILSKGKDKIWGTKIELKDTFFSNFKNPFILDLPGFNYDKEQHNKERYFLKNYFFTTNNEEKNIIRKKYNEHSFNHYKNIKYKFENSLKNDHDLIVAYFSIADVIGHLNFGNIPMMRIIYNDLDEISKKIKGDLIILSDHGMKGVGIFGDHSNYGFWSTNFKDLGNPKITDFKNII